MQIVKLVAGLFLMCVVGISAKYCGQFGQDKYLDEVLFKKRVGGFFVDIGAYDGVTISNTYFFEQNRQWRGLCIEPQPDKFKLLKKNRTCASLNCGISDFLGRAEFFQVNGGAAALWSGLVNTYDQQQMETVNKYLSKYGGSVEKITVPVYPLSYILKQHQIGHVDLLCIDTEGCEDRIIKSINFDQVDIEVIVVENNSDSCVLRAYLTSKNYDFICRLGVDDIFKKRLT